MKDKICFGMDLDVGTKRIGISFYELGLKVQPPIFKYSNIYHKILFTI